MKFSVIVDLFPKFEERIKKFQRKFNKYGEGTITYTKSEPYLREFKDTTGKEHEVKAIHVNVEGHYQVSGYEFIASLEYKEELRKNLVKKAPNTADIPEMYLTRTYCDHCKVDRFRKYTVLLKNTETNEYVQAGKSCVKDYLGCDVNSFTAYFSCWDSLEEYLESLERSDSYHFKPVYTLDEILEQTIGAKNQYGYVSKAMIERWYDDNHDDRYDVQCPFKKTSSIVYDILNKIKVNGKLLYPKYEVTDSIRDEVIRVKDFITTCEQVSDYVHNLKTLLQLSCIESKDVGLVVSMVGYYLRETTRAEEAYKREATPEQERPQHVGNVGEKIEFTAKPECVFSTETAYGMLFYYKFVINNKDIIVWKTGKHLNCDVDLRVQGTVKSHVMFKGTKQAEITRAKTQLVAS